MNSDEAQAQQELNELWERHSKAHAELLLILEEIRNVITKNTRKT